MAKTVDSGLFMDTSLVFCLNKHLLHCALSDAASLQETTTFVDDILGNNWRNVSRVTGDKMENLSFRPLPGLTKINIRELSMSPAFRQTTSPTRNPAEYNTVIIVLCFRLVNAPISFATSCSLNTLGNRAIFFGRQIFSAAHCLPKIDSWNNLRALIAWLA